MAARVYPSCSIAAPPGLVLGCEDSHGSIDRPRRAGAGPADTVAVGQAQATHPRPFKGRGIEHPQVVQSFLVENIGVVSSSAEEPHIACLIHPMCGLIASAGH